MSREPRLTRDPIGLAVENWRGRGWTDSADGMAVVTSVMRVHQLLLAAVEERLRPLGLTFARYEVLMLLGFSRHGRLPVGKIGERLQVHPASVTNAVDRLEDDGLVQRVPNPADGRSVLASITPQGRELAERASELLNREVFGALPLDAADARRLNDVMTTIRRSFGDFE